MADLLLLPATAYTPPSPLGRSQGQPLNTIIEEDHEDSAAQSPTSRRRNNGKSVEKIEQWLSPLSDHFPTPRGFHFLRAPIVPSTPSAVTEECDVDETSSEASSSNPSTQMSRHRESVMTDATEFDDMSDLSEDDRTRKEHLRVNGIARQHGSKSSKSSRRASRGSLESRRALTPLVIPAKRDSSTESWSGTAHLKKITSPVPPTPSSKVELSPIQLAFMQAQQASEVPTISAPPSLDGSLTSEELAAMSAPPTPLIGAKYDKDDGWSGVQLQPGALATLQALSSSDDEALEEEHQNQVIEVPQEEMSETRQQTPRLITNVRPMSMAIATPQQRPLTGLTKLEIPSPGGFFSELSSASRNTWHVPSMTGDDVGPPTSTTAEQFYKTPWNKTESLPPPPPRPFHMENASHPSTVVEQVVELPETRIEDLPTAIRVQPTPEPITARKVPPVRPPNSTKGPPAQSSDSDRLIPRQPSSPVDATEIVVDYDPNYARQQQEVALSHLDRTELWLMAQRAYLNGIIGPQEEHEREDIKPEPEEKLQVPVKDVETKESEPEASTTQKKKTVRFSDATQTTSIPKRLPSMLTRQESAYYRAFTDFIVRSHQHDAFVHRLPRFEALQAQRISFGEAHRNQLLGKFQLSVVPQSAKKRMSANVARGDDVLVDDPEKLRADKEHEAFCQMSMATWNVSATKLLNGGQLISAPVARRLARQSRMLLSGPDGATTTTRDRARILDLGGQGACDWAWHAALKYPNAKIYTVTTKAIRQLSNSNIRGPPNHRQIAVDRLTKLPFSDDQFDLVSARELHSILKFVGENGEDEWEACLAECARVLKPGGYLEFSVLDSDVMNAGPRGLAKSVEFGFTLKTLGYDPNPTRLFLGRLDRAGFEGVRRAWMCLPMGPKPKAAAAARLPTAAVDPSTGLPGATLELEAMVSGSADAAAAITGLAAGWGWERWLLRTEAEKMAGELRLADTVAGGRGVREAAAKGIGGVHGIVEEGRAVGAAFRLLRGYARKPSTATGVISMVLDTEI